MKTNPSSKRKTGKRIAFSCGVILLILLFATACMISYLMIFSNPGATPSDRISKGVVPTNEDLANAKVYDRVIVIGVDGAGADGSGKILFIAREQI